MKRKAIVIGSGIGGIATAIRLSLKEMKVVVFEKEEYPGGKLSSFDLDNYRFDFGPSLFTLPHLVDELFQLAGKKPDDYFRYERMDLACKYFWKDGTVIHAWTDSKKFANEVNQKLGVEPEILLSYLSHTMKLYNKISPVFLERSLHSLRSYFSYDFLKAGTYMHGADIFKTMNQANQKRLNHPRLVQIFNRMATYNGSSPFKAPGILNVISSLEHVSGTYFPQGGMYSITSSLHRLAEELGVEFRFSEEVKKIEHKNGKIQGVSTEKGNYSASVVVSNMDIFPSYYKLLKDLKKPVRILSQERSSSALVFYWGIKKEFPDLGLHNIFFSDNYREEFLYLFENLSVYHDPTIYINISSKKNSKDAPPGHENWFVMINAPYNEGQDWYDIISKTRKNVIQKLSLMLNRDIKKYIVTEFILDPQTIEIKTSSYKGSIYGTSSNSNLAAFLRHPNFSPKIRGLYFTGGSVHPGGGIPLCLLSAKIVSDLI